MHLSQTWQCVGVSHMWWLWRHEGVMENNRDLALCGRIRVSQRRGQVATGEGVTSVAMGTPGLKDSWSKAQTWHHVAGRSPCGRVRRPLVSAKPQSQWRTQDIGRARAMQRPWETVTGVEWGWPKPGDRVCTVDGNTREVNGSSLSEHRRSWMSTRCQTLSYRIWSYTIFIWFCSGLLDPMTRCLR